MPRLEKKSFSQQPQRVVVIQPKKTKLKSYGGGGGGWHQRAPLQQWKRQQVYQKCGPKCFLLPGRLKFPICAWSPHISCQVDPDGLRAAAYRARQYHYTNVASKAKKRLSQKNKHLP